MYGLQVAEDPRLALRPTSGAEFFSSGDAEDLIRRHVAMSSLLAVGCYDGKIRLLSSNSWEEAFILPLNNPRVRFIL